MLGWINDCVEKLVIAKFGLEAWHTIKDKAGCTVADGGFYKLDVYADKSTVDLVMAATEVSGLTAEQVLETFGAFFVEYVRDEGYENLLVGLGSNLKDFMANINAMHQHLQNTFPKKMTMPQLWVEDHDAGDGSLVLHYHSKRGSLLAPVAKGVMLEIAKSQFGYAINMERLRTQGEDGADFTSWRITTADPKELWKLTTEEKVTEGAPISPDTRKCPFTGMTFEMRTDQGKSAKMDVCSHEARSSSQTSQSRDGPRPCKKRKGTDTDPQSCRTHSIPQCAAFQTTDEVSDLGSNNSMQGDAKASTACAHVSGDECTETAIGSSDIGLSGTVTKSLFPYHVMINSDFTIAQVGNKLSQVLNKSEEDLLGQNLVDVFVLTEPVGVEWNWKWLQLLQGQTFEVEPLGMDDFLYSFKTTVVHVSSSPCVSMLVLTPEVHNLGDMREMKLTFSDLPLHSAHRDSILLREHLNSQMNSALRMEKLSKSLKMEKTLLESMLPSHAAEGLRKGETVVPRLHNNVTFFFSDIVGFTNLCNQLYPWQVIEMLNRLYCVMDSLAKKFNLFKVETIGDAYVACSGLPASDPNHARNVANFAIAVRHCCKQIVSPVDASPIQLRMGIHSGACASGIVGSTNPRYCVFGDTVNVTARHEQSCVPGHIHCSSTSQAELEARFKGSFVLSKRGLVDMKGKGKLTTFWLEADERNEFVNSETLPKVDAEMRSILESTNFTTAMPVVDGERALEEEVKSSESDVSLLQRIGSLNKRFKAQDRDSSKVTGILNVDWGSPPASSYKQWQGQKNHARAGNSLFHVVNRSQEAT